MKILHVVHQYLPEQVGGTEFYTQWVAHRLAQRGHKVDIFYRRFAPGEGCQFRLDEDDVRVWAAWAGTMSPSGRFMATFKAPALLDAFIKVFEQCQPELVHIQHLMGLPVSIVNYIQARNIPFIITLHDYWWVCANAQLITNYSQQLCAGPQAYLNCARCALARANHAKLWPAVPLLAPLLAQRNRLLRHTMNAAAKLITPTQFVCAWHTACDVDASLLQVIPHGLDTPPPPKHQSKQPADPMRFVYIGGLSWQKGVHILVEAFQGLDGSAELWIAGDEAADPVYMAQLQQLASPRVRFLGKLTHDAVWQTLTQADIAVVVSLWYETFSFIISEAFAAGVPVLASDLGPLGDRVSHKVDGLLFPAGDVPALRQTMQRFLDEPALLSQLQAGIQPPRTLDDHVAELEGVYQRVVSK